MAVVSLPLSLAIFFFMFSHLPNTLQAAGGFSVELIHIDSPRSPFYNPLDTVSDRIARAVLLSNSRINYIRAISSTNLTSKVLPDSLLEYLMTISLGTPPVQIYAIADTGSDLIWTKCSPQIPNPPVPLFDPKHSSTYRHLSCCSPRCSLLPKSSSKCAGESALNCTNHGRCRYSYAYGAESQSTIAQGVLSEETLTMMSNASRSSVKIPKLVFGCTDYDNATRGSSGSGLVGLGAGPLSLISQLRSYIHGKFSYCLVPRDRNSSSQMDFGDSAIVSGKGAVSTPLISKRGFENFYVVKLLKITVGKKIISVPVAYQSNIIVDSGTTLTNLPTSVYNSLVSAVNASIGRSLPPAKDPNKQFDLCYKTGANDQVPELKFGFDHGAEITLNKLNTFLQVSEDVACFAFMASDSIAIIGNIAQINFKVGYDLKAMKLSFQPTNCEGQ